MHDCLTSAPLMLTLLSIQNSSAHQVWPRIPYTHLRMRSRSDRASRSDSIRSSESGDAIPGPNPDPIRSSESDDAIPSPNPDPMIGSFDPNHDSTVLSSLMWQTVKTGNDNRSRFNRSSYLQTETFRMVLTLIFTWSLLSCKIFSSRFFQYNKP